MPPSEFVDVLAAPDPLAVLASAYPDDLLAFRTAGTAGQAPISAGNLGWKPRLIAGGNSGEVSEGEEVVTVLDDPTQPGNNVGLTDQELLVSTYDSAAVAGGTYSVNADLFLRTPADVAAGSYRSTLTLSLFE